jgi:hypothetical protein
VSRRRTGGPVLLAGLVSSLVAMATGASAADWAVAVQTDRHLDALALAHLGDDAAWSRLSPRPGRNLGYLFDELRLTRHTEGGYWSLLARQRVVAVVSEGALDLARTVDAGGDPSGDRRWSVALDSLGFSGVGVEFGRRLDLGGGWQGDAACQGLQLQRLTARQAHGEAAYQAATATYSAELTSREIDNRLTFPYQSAVAGHGLGLLCRAGVQWRGGPWTVAVEGRDAGVLSWNGLPQQDAVLSTDQQTVGADGFVTYRPLVQGRNTQPRLRRTLAPISTWSVGWAAPSLGRFHADVVWLPGWGALPGAGWARAFGDWQLGLGWRVHERRAEVSVARGGWRLALVSDGQSASRSAGFRLDWRVAPP